VCRKSLSAFRDFVFRIRHADDAGEEQIEGAKTRVELVKGK
jgi:hypothetical protein